MNMMQLASMHYAVLNFLLIELWAYGCPLLSEKWPFSLHYQTNALCDQIYLPRTFSQLNLGAKLAKILSKGDFYPLHPQVWTFAEIVVWYEEFMFHWIYKIEIIKNNLFWNVFCLFFRVFSIFYFSYKLDIIYSISCS